MNKINKSTIDKIGRAAVMYDWELAFGGKSYGNRHLYRVNKIAKFLQKKEGGDLDIVLLGAWIHDVSLVAGSDYVEDRVLTETSKFLNNFEELSCELKEKVIQCAVDHEKTEGVVSIESKIVHDADALDKCGALGVIRHIWKMTNMLENRPLTSKSDFNNLEKHLKERKVYLQTESARKIAKEIDSYSTWFFLNKIEALNWMQEISLMAWRGEISDKIAEKLINKNTGMLFDKLKSQIDCTYLEE